MEVRENQLKLLNENVKKFLQHIIGKQDTTCFRWPETRAQNVMGAVSPWLSLGQALLP